MATDSYSLEPARPHLYWSMQTRKRNQLSFFLELLTLIRVLVVCFSLLSAADIFAFQATWSCHKLFANLFLHARQQQKIAAQQFQIKSDLLLHSFSCLIVSNAPANNANSCFNAFLWLMRTRNGSPLFRALLLLLGSWSFSAERCNRSEQQTSLERTDLTCHFFDRNS